MPNPIAPADYHLVEPLFAGFDHNVALVWAILEGNSLGQVFVDRGDAPATALLTSEVGYCYIAGRADNPAFNEALVPLLFEAVVPQMEEKELVLFAFSDAWRSRLDGLLCPRGGIVISRKILRFSQSRFAAHAGWRDRIPEGVQVRTIDAAVAERYPAYRPLLEPRSKRFGFCLLRGDEMVSACTSVSVGGGEAEIDIQTAEPYQGRGYGLLTACAFIEESLARGLRPSWACWPYRTASQALALKLGFEPRPDVPAHYWVEKM